MTRFFKRTWKWFAALACVGMLGALAIAWEIGGAFCEPANRPVGAAGDLAIENISFESKSGTTIHGWLVTPATNHGVVILQHGVGGTRNDMVERAKFLSKAGYAVLLFDFQAHGESIGKKITLGFRESRDSQAAVEFVKQRFPGKPIGVIGVSMGAAAAALANPPLDVQALVLEIMYPTIADATKDRIEIRLGPHSRWLSPILTLQIPLRLGFSSDELRPIVQVEKITTPKLFLAGTKDRDTKIGESEQIFARAAEPKKIVEFVGAHHEDLHTFAPDHYEKLVLNFLEEHLK